MIEIKAPKSYQAYLDKTAIFLAGSIEMGVAEDWQKKVSAALMGLDVLLLNPRRDAWDSSWEQTIDNPKFKEQVEWELDALDRADLILMYFVPKTKSPITLLELGIHAVKSPQKLIVCCPDGFWRKGNVDIVCARYGVEQSESLDQLIQKISHKINNLKQNIDINS